jgi:hypothetical protein
VKVKGLSTRSNITHRDAALQTVKHYFYIPPMLVVWRRTDSHTGAFATQYNLENKHLAYDVNTL